MLSLLFPEHLFLTEPCHLKLCFPISLFCSKVLKFQHAICRENFLPTLTVRISLDDDRECLTLFPANSNSTSPWLTALFMPLSSDTITQSMLCLRKVKHGRFLLTSLWFWYRVFILLLVGCLAQSGTTPHRISYIQPPWHECTGC